MKKVILSSILSLVLCVSLIAGGTFALFTSDSKTNIAVNSGKVEVVATLEKAEGEWVYSPSAIDYDSEEIPSSATNAADQKTGEFVNGGFATLNEEKLTLTNMTPGDKVMLNIRITNNSSVAVKYSTRLWVSENDGLFEGLKVSVNNAPFTYTQQTAWTDLAVGSDDIVIPVVVELPADAGNEFQSKNATLSFSVSAVQANADTNALENNAPDTVYLYSQSDLFMFAESVNGGNNYLGKTVVLVNDIDLQNKPWTPIGSMGDVVADRSFYGSFNGNNKTISNLNVTTAGRTTTGFFGQFGGVDGQTIENLTINGATLVGEKWAGVVVGYVQTLNAITTFTNVHVNDVTVTGDRVGAITGFVSDNGNAEKPNVTFDNCSVTKANLNYASSVGAIAGHNYAGTVFNPNVKSSGVTTRLCAANDAMLADALESANAGDTIYLGAATFSPINLKYKDYNLVGAVNADGTPATTFLATKTPVGDKDAGYWGGFTGSVKNVIFTAEDGVANKYFGALLLGGGDTAAVADASFENCHFINQGISVNGEAQFKKCVFDGQGKVGSAINYSTINGDIVFDGCSFSGYSVSINVAESDNANIIVRNSTVSSKVELGLIKAVTFENSTLDAEVVLWCACDATFTNTPFDVNSALTVYDNVNVTVNGNSTLYCPVATQEKLNAAVSADSENIVVLLADGEYDFPILDAIGGKTVAFVGSENTVIDATAVNHIQQQFRDATFIFENLTINWALQNAGYQGFANGLEKVTYNNCTIVGTTFMYGNADFNDCTFITPEGYTGYNVYGRGVGTLNFDNCEFYTAGRAIMLYADQTTSVTVNLTDCKFYDTVGTVYSNNNGDPKSAVETGDGQEQTSTFNITFTNCTADGFEANKSTSSLWGNKDSIPEDRLTVVIGNETVYGTVAE